MKEFKSCRSYWDFRREIMQNYRYVWSTAVNDFLETVLLTSRTRYQDIPAEKILWRAQLGFDFQPYYQEGEYLDDVPAPYSTNRMKPLRAEAREGRANPKGIPYLYLANKKETALSEARPWRGSIISIGQFKLNRKIKIVNCSSTEQRHLIYLEEPDQKEREKAVWIDIDKAFSQPIEASDTTAGYTPTQILAELFKKEGLDGIAYRSAFGAGHNIMLFDIDAAEIINCFLYEVKKIDFTFTQTAGHYFVRKDYEEK
jgi:hypothetical protein